MHLVQILLPLRDNDGRPYPASLLQSINSSLIAEFGGVTTYSRSPAKGTWINADHEERDDVIIIEVMTEALNRDWWLSFRERLEAKMNQSEVVVRAHLIDRL